MRRARTLMSSVELARSVRTASAWTKTANAYGYETKTYSVITEDGWSLELHNIVGQTGQLSGSRRLSAAPAKKEVSIKSHSCLVVLEKSTHKLLISHCRVTCNGSYLHH